jgi:hypothetical protein
VKDGKQVLFEFDLLNTGEDSPIEYNEKETPEELNIELTRTSSIDIED